TTASFSPTARITKGTVRSLRSGRSTAASDFRFSRKPFKARNTRSRDPPSSFSSLRWAGSATSWSAGAQPWARELRPTRHRTRPTEHSADAETVGQHSLMVDGNADALRRDMRYRSWHTADLGRMPEV